MVDYAGNAIPAAGFNATTNVPDDELLYSTAGFTQKGVQLEAGQGVLYLGTVLARKTDTKKYVKYNSGGSNGTNVAVGVLRKTVDTGLVAPGAGVQEYMANIVIAGILKLQKVSSANGGVPSVLGAVTNAVLGTFKI